MLAQRPLRRSQIISPFGIGSIVDFPNDESLMTAGMDAWPFAKERCPPEFLVVEERLQRRLGVAELRLPPDYRDPAPGVARPKLSIPFVRFPRWHYCPLCGSVEKLGLFGGSQRCSGPQFTHGLSCHNKPQNRRPRLLPVRFIAVCERGHIQDFPFMEWVHKDAPETTLCHITRLRAGRTTTALSGVVIECACGASRTLSGAFADDALENRHVRCQGLRPWLGETQGDTARCGGSLKVVQRGASNVYFAHIATSIYLPLWAEKVRSPIIEILEDPKTWSILTSGLVNGRNIDMVRCEVIAANKPWLNITAEELQQAAQKRLDNAVGQPLIAGNVADGSAEEEEYRQAEYEALRNGLVGADTELYTTAKRPDEYTDPVCRFFSRITLVHKLRETRAFYGFSRNKPDDDRSYQEKIADLRLDGNLNWLPATVVRGEGIFFEINTGCIDAWLHENRLATSRLFTLTERYNQVRATRGQPARNVLPRFVLLHTLAHMLINQLSYECGYGSSSLRERIYCNMNPENNSMNGFLIYTASGDAEGTMGGLVRQGQPGRIEPVLARALRKASWCSYDPICMESQGQGPDSCNLAACHGCAILPETSCEEGNRLLDRAMVVGSPERPEIGFFGAYLSELLQI